ncbi:Coq4 family protein [Sphingomonas sp. MMS24-JH45]
MFRVIRALERRQRTGQLCPPACHRQGRADRLRAGRASAAFLRSAFVAQFAPGAVGAAYRDFLESTGYSADGLVQVSREGYGNEDDPLHPYAWMGRRIRDSHDILGTSSPATRRTRAWARRAWLEFSYAQVGGLGWAFIAGAASLKSLKITGNRLFAKAVWEGYRHGRQAKWISGEDVLTLLHEPIEAARARLGIREPVAYREAQRVLGPEMASYLSQQREALAA